VIIFDESHAMQNAVGGEGERGDQAASQQGRAGLRLQHALPNARVVYVSPTGATTVHNLAYAQRLGLWGGEDFPFATRAEFVLVIAGFVLLVRGWIWLSVRFPLTMMFINCFIAALLGGRRRRW
jgi:nicotinamide riboside transporter PnuC